jgi:hypothetical protein
MKRILMFFVFTVVLGSLFAFSADYDAQFDSQYGVETTMIVGAKYPVSLTFINTGTIDWTRAGKVRLGSQNPQDNLIWGFGRVDLKSQVPSGSEYTFNFTVTAPYYPGYYNFQWQMLKEGVKWFGEKSPNVVVHVIRPAYQAIFISQSVPTTMYAGATYNVNLTFRNLGTNPWSCNDDIYLGSQMPQDNLNWGIGRVPMQDGVVVSRPDDYTFTFNVTAPLTPKIYNFQWQMLKEGVQWFGDYSTNVRVNVIAPDFNAQFIEQNVPDMMITGKKYQVSITFKNTGGDTWTKSEQIKLGSQYPADNVTWGFNRVELGDAESITTGQSKTFTFTVTAPDDCGVMDFQWRMLKENLSEFGDFSPNVAVLVRKEVKIITPQPEDNVSGEIPVTVDVTSDVAKVEFYVDGVLLDSVNSPISNPYTFYWDSTVNHVPAPTHPIDYGYYGVVGIQGNDNHEVDFSGEVNCYTNSFIGGRAAYKCVSNWANLLDGDLNLAVSQGRRIELNLDMQNPNYMNNSYLDEVFDVAAPYWDHIVRLELADEPDWNRATTESMIQDVQNALLEHDLSDRPMGVTINPNSNYYDDVVNATGLDWVGIEAYLKAPGDDFSQVNIDYLYTVMNSAMSIVPADKDIVLVQMSFNLSGYWTNMDTLRDLQIPTYLLAYNNPRVDAIRMFAYSRPAGNQGARENPELKTPQILVGEKILNVSNPYSGQGRRTILVKAYDSSDVEIAFDTVIVNVGQVPPTNPCE